MVRARTDNPNQWFWVTQMRWNVAFNTEELMGRKTPACVAAKDYRHQP